MPTLYQFQRSGNCYKVRLMAALLGVAHETVSFDPPSGAHKQPEYLAINPLGQVPAWVEDDDGPICDSQAILVYLAKRYDASGTWFPNDARTAAEVTRWLSFTAYEILYGIAFTRAMVSMGRPGDPEVNRPVGEAALATLERELSDRDWLASDHPTIADIAAYPYVSVASAGGFSLDGYPAVGAWCDRIEVLDGFQPFNPNG